MNFSKGETRLTRDGRLKMDPVVLGGGTEIVYTLQETPTQFALVRLKTADGSTERLHPSATTSEFEATYSADGRMYAFVQSRGNLNLKMVIRDSRTNREAVFDPGGGFSGVRRPAMTPDGKRVVFGIPAATGQVIASVDAEGKDRKTLTQGGVNNWPACSPDGKQIAFASSREGKFDLFVMNADGSEVRRLTRGGAGMDCRPAWSPDSKRIAFTSNRDGNYEIYVIRADGSGLCRVTRNDERDDYANWHPDGKRLVIVGEREGKFDLYLVEVPA
jgi:Tol biopolymer transport system component